MLLRHAPNDTAPLPPLLLVVVVVVVVVLAATLLYACIARSCSAVLASRVE
jgi:hypothetical protein